MASLNKVQLIGNLGRDPDVHDGQAGTIVRFSIATTRTWKDKEGAKNEETEWHDCCVFGKLADVVKKFAHKGMNVYVEGRLRSHQYQDKNGVEKTQKDIIVENFLMLGGKFKSEEAPAQAPESKAISEDDPPF